MSIRIHEEKRNDNNLYLSLESTVNGVNVIARRGHAGQATTIMTFIINRDAAEILSIDSGAFELFEISIARE